MGIVAGSAADLRFGRQDALGNLLCELRISICILVANAALLDTIVP